MDDFRVGFAVAGCLGSPVAALGDCRLRTLIVFGEFCRLRTVIGFGDFG